MIEPVKIEDGQIITEPGAYDVSMDWYHSQCCDGPSVSSTGLRTLYHKSPATFWAYSDLNDNRFVREETEAFTFGKAAHALLLGDANFDEEFAVLPATAPQKPTPQQISAREQGRISESAAERFDFWDIWDQKHYGKLVLTEADMVHIGYIAEQLQKHPLVSLLLEGAREQSLFWKDRLTGLWLKSRVDVLSVTGDAADLKSTARDELGLLMKDIQHHGYDMQLGLGSMGLEEVASVPFTPDDYAARTTVLIFVYKKPPYHVMPVEVPYDSLVIGRRKCRMAIDRMAECIRDDFWPGPVEGIAVYHPPQWEVERLEAVSAD